MSGDSTLRRTWIAAVIAALWTTVANAQQPSMLELTRGAEYVFTGAVVEGAAAGGTAVVQIEEIYLGASNVGGYPGAAARVRVARGVEKGESWLWFTRVRGWSELVELQETGRLAAEDRATIRKAVDASAATVDDERFRDYLQTADVIVRGRVVSVAERPLEPELQLDEHDAQWTLAQIEVVRVLEGEAGKRVDVLFPRSEDIMWFRVPKLKPGDSGIFLLHRRAMRPLRRETPALYLADWRDVQPLAQEERIVRLLRTVRGAEVKR